MSSSVLDAAFIFPSRIENEVRVDDGDDTAIYTAELSRIECVSLDFWGYARLSKRLEPMQAHIEAPTEVPQHEPDAIAVRTQGRWSGLLSLVRQSTRTPQSNQDPAPEALAVRPVWSITTDARKFITSGGRAISDVTKSSGYRCCLISCAANAGLVLSGALIQMVFGPLERQLEDYREGLIRAASA